MQVNDMPTQYGCLSYSLRGLDAQTPKFEIHGRIAAKVVLRPPLAAELRSVTVNGTAHGHFDGDSVTLFDAPAELIRTTF